MILNLKALTTAAGLALAVSYSFSAAAGEGLRKQHTILSGVFYTAGGSGGEHSLTDHQVHELCEDGYSTIYYLYTKNFPNKGTNNCGSNKVDYLAATHTGSGLRKIFQRVYQVLQTGDGPVLAHCWNGRHAAGAVAAKGLMQFCDWSASQALDFWLSNAGADGRKYTTVINDIRAFTPYSEFRLSPSEQARYCP